MNTNENKNTYANGKGNVIYMNARELTTMEQFSKKVEEMLKTKLPGNLDIYLDKVVSNNGHEQMALAIFDNSLSSGMAPCIYLEKYLDYYRKGASMNELADAMIAYYKHFKVGEPKNFEFLNDFEKVKNHIGYILVNAEKNAKLLQESPHIVIYDLAIIFRIHMDELLGEEGYLTIRNHISEPWNKSAEELFDIALANMEKKVPVKILPLKDVMLAELKKELPEELFEEAATAFEMELQGPELYHCSNEDNAKGAGTIFYPNVLKDFAQEHNSSFFIIPSTIHECLFLLDDGKVDVELMLATIKETNDSIMYEEDVLSDNLYYYNAKMDYLCIVDEDFEDFGGNC